MTSRLNRFQHVIRCRYASLRQWVASRLHARQKNTLTKTLLIYVNSEDTTKFDWIMVDRTGETQLSSDNADTTDLAELAKDSNVVVIIPGEDILLTSVTLPTLSRQRLRQALPFALEDKLIEETENYHFVTGERQEDGTIPVAVITKQKMEQTLAKLSAMHLHSYQMIPSIFAIPYTPEHATTALVDHIRMVRTGKYAGFACDNHNSDLFLALDQSKQPYDELLFTEKSFLEHAYVAIKQFPPLNLTQGEYYLKAKTSFQKTLWRANVILVASWMGLLVLGNAVSYFFLHNNAKKTESAIHAIYKKHFPFSTSMVAPRERMEAKLKKLSAKTRDNPMLHSLGFIANSLKHTAAITCTKMDFHDTTWRLAVTSDSFDTLDNFLRSLKQQGLSAKTQGAAMNNTTVKATIIISTGAA